MDFDTSKFKERVWKTGVLAPDDAKRPVCRVMYSYDGKKQVPDQDETDAVDWLIVVAYETKE